MSITDDIRRAAKILEATLPLSEGDLAARLLAAIPAIKEMEKDAARYQWLRRKTYTKYDAERVGLHLEFFSSNCRADRIAAFNEAVDAALAKEGS